jgi:hypothetical protein
MKGRKNMIRTGYRLAILLAALSAGSVTLWSGPKAKAFVVSPDTGNGAGTDQRDGQHDFDFFIGEWKLHNRRLKQTLAGSTEWYEFDLTSVARKIWGGKANMDEMEGDTPTGHIAGMTVRLYNAKSHEWSLYWANSANPILENPTIGSFKDGRGEFFDQENYQGRTILCRYIWSNITANSAHWEQAFSVDGGKTWETNWITDLTRTK